VRRAPLLTAVDSHTCGQPTRVIVDGLPALEYSSIAEARNLLRSNHDWVRRLSVLEPRGHPGLMGVALLSPAESSHVCAAVFMDAAGYPDMCGHATIGVAATLVELGLVPPDGEHRLVVETPAGGISVVARTSSGRLESASFVGQPAYVLETVAFGGPAGTARATIAYGGQWYAFVDAADVGLAVEPEQIDALVDLAARIRPAIQAAVTRADPRAGERPRVENVMWFDNPRRGDVDGRNMPVNAAAGIDRSPCGTGTCARLALLHARGDLRAGDVYRNSGVIGTVYTGRIVATTDVGGVSAVIPEITGTARITGAVDLYADEDDPSNGRRGS
jgi:proline racemase